MIFYRNSNYLRFKGTKMYEMHIRRSVKEDRQIKIYNFDKILT